MEHFTLDWLENLLALGLKVEGNIKNALKEMMNSIWMSLYFTLCGWVESTDSSSYLTLGVCKQIFS